MDLMEAFANVTKDTNWMKKIAIGGGLLLLSVIAEIISIFFKSERVYINEKK